MEEVGNFPQRGGVMIAIDKQWRSSRLRMSLFLILHPVQCIGLYQMAPWSKPIPRWMGFPVCHRTSLQQDFAQEKTWPRLERWVCFFQAEQDMPRACDCFLVGLFICFILYLCLCLGFDLFILQVIAYLIRNPTHRELSVLSCLMTICLEEVFSFLSVLQLSKFSRDPGDDKKLQNWWWFFFFFFFGEWGSSWLCCHVPRVCLCSCFPTLFNHHTSN